jgi:hypothetical protein
MSDAVRPDGGEFNPQHALLYLCAPLGKGV